MRDDELEALAVRVEASSGPDRELDAEIAVAARTGLPSGCNWAFAFPKWDAEPGRSGLVRIIGNVNGNCDDITGRFAAPTFTASLDAAMTLVPSGKYCSVWRWTNGTGSVEVGGLGRHCAATPALALVAAALRAMKGQP